MRPRALAKSGPPIPSVSERPNEVSIRELRESDNLDDLTGLLHRAYARLADMNLKFVATWQDTSITRKRIARSTCFVAVMGGRIIGTVCFHSPDSRIGSPWMDRPDVAHVGQLAVEPDYQNRGIGRRLMVHCENYARQLGAAHIALDTAEPAVHLIDWYRRQGYRIVEKADWDVTNYKSVVMSKPLK